MKKIYCHHCKKLITTKDELAVVGKSFIPYHIQCFDSIKHQNIYAFYSGYKTNGIFPWIMLVLLNGMAWGAFFLFDAPVDEVTVMSLFVSGTFIFYRALSYILYERYY